jgi:hypothetical protein
LVEGGGGDGGRGIGGGVSFSTGNGSAGGLSAEVVAHLLRDSADLRARINAIEAAQSKTELADSDECFDVHVVRPAGHKNARLIAVPARTTVQELLNAVPAPPSLKAVKGKLVLYADAEGGLLLPSQTCGRLRRHVMPTAAPADPLVLHLGLIPQ